MATIQVSNRGIEIKNKFFAMDYANSHEFFEQIRKIRGKWFLGQPVWAERDADQKKGSHFRIEGLPNESTPVLQR